MYTRWNRFLLSLVLAIGFVGEAAAELSLELGVEGFRWREYDAGAHLLEESRPRFRLGANWRQPLGIEQRNFVQLRGGLYFGDVDYDGQACELASETCFPFMTETAYHGAFAEAAFARHFGRLSGGEVFAGGGIDAWRRHVRGRDDVAGAVEYWTTFYLLAGTGARWTQSAARYQAQVGLKYPFYTHEWADFFEVTLEPKGTLSFFARLATDFMHAGRPRWGLGLYYDSYRFDESNKELAILSGDSFLVWQPESRQDTIGVYAIVYLR